MSFRTMLRRAVQVAAAKVAAGAPTARATKVNNMTRKVQYSLPCSLSAYLEAMSISTRSSFNPTHGPAISSNLKPQPTPSPLLNSYLGRSSSPRQSRPWYHNLGPSRAPYPASRLILNSAQLDPHLRTHRPIRRAPTYLDSSPP